MDASPTHEFPGFLRDSMTIHRTKVICCRFLLFLPKASWFVHLSDFLQYCKRHVVGLIYIVYCVYNTFILIYIIYTSYLFISRNQTPGDLLRHLEVFTPKFISSRLPGQIASWHCNSRHRVLRWNHHGEKHVDPKTSRHEQRRILKMVV